MRIVVALGGNALLRRGESMTVEAQRHNVRIAATALAPVAQHHQLVLSHGNGPQIGLLALQAESYKAVEPYPLDVLGAQTQGMIGYLLEQELGNLLPMEVPFASILTMIEVDPHDPSFQDPTKFIGPVYEEEEATRIAQENHWTFKQDGAKWRRVVASPHPKRIFEIRPIHWLLEHGTIVICAGGGGIPTVYDPEHRPTAGCRGRHRQGLRRRIARARSRGRHVRHGYRCRGCVPGLGHTDGALPAAHHAFRARAVRLSGRAAWDPRLRPRASSSRRPATPRQSAL